MRLSFSQAIEYVVSTKGRAFAFLPEVRRGQQIGGQIFVLIYNEGHDEDPTEDAYRLYHSAARFHSSECEEDTYLPDEIPDAARQLHYQPTKAEFSDFNGMETQIGLQRLADGIPKT